MKQANTILLTDRLAFRAGSRYYPFIVKRKTGANGETTFTLEMRIGKNDVIVSDAPTLEEVLKRHEDLLGYAFETRGLQGWASAKEKAGGK